MELKDTIKQEIINIYKLFVFKGYETLKKRYLSDDREIEDFIRALHEYWEFWEEEGTVTMPSIDEFNNIEIIEIDTPRNALREFNVTFDFWINDEKSDLTLECYIEYYNQDDMRAYLYDLHVM